jgi:hypothetical protein
MYNPEAKHRGYLLESKTWRQTFHTKIPYALADEQITLINRGSALQGGELHLL